MYVSELLLSIHCCKMASYESNLEALDNYSVKNIIQVQSYVRRWLVKKMVKEIKQLYTNVVIDLEGQENEVTWPRETLSCPSFRKFNKAVADSSRIKDCLLVNQSCKHELSQPLASKQNISKPGSQMELYMGDSSVKQQNFVNAQPQTKPPHDDLDLTLTSKPGLHISVNMESSTLKQQNFISAESQTESSYYDLDVTPTFLNSVNPTEIVFKQASQCLVDATDNTNSNMSALNLGYGESKSVHPQTLRLTSSVHCIDTDDEMQPVIGPVSHYGAQRSPERLHPDKDDGETYEKIVGIKNSVAEGSGIISELGEPSPQTLSIQEKVSTISRDLPDDKDQLLQLKSTMAMELLWVQQAINSRKNYLRLKQGIQ